MIRTKKFQLLLFLLVISVGGNSFAQLNIVPSPLSVGLKKGFFTFDNNLLIQCPESKRTNEIISYFSNFAIYEKWVDSNKIKINPACAGNLVFRYDTSIHHAEGYKLEINKHSIYIEARTDTGFFWGMQTLRQLMLTEGKDKLLPCFKIEDEPRYSWRSNMLDCSRHFYDVAFLKRYLDILSFYKINIFHWHLTDDQGWRIEIKKYPKLTQKGAWRTEADGRKYGGFYTQEEIKEIVEYARQRNIMVIPEIEMPGHCSAVLSAYPALSCKGEELKVPANFGVFKDVFCAGKEETFTFLKNVLDEVITLFPSSYIHIGGDEVPKDRWKECPQCQSRMKNENLKEEGELQAYFIKRIQSYLKTKGKIVIGWDEILEGGADKDAIIEVWRGKEEADKALKNGNKIIQTVYLDASPANRTLEDVFYHSPQDGVGSAFQHLVVGSDCPLWTEYITENNCEAMLLPRLLAFSEVMWLGERNHQPVSGNDSEYTKFKKKLPAQYAMLSHMGVAYGPENKRLFSLQMVLDTITKCWTIHALRGMNDISFSLKALTLEHFFQNFSDSIRLCDYAKYQVIPMRMGKALSDPVLFEAINHLALGNKVVFQNPYSEKYAQAGALGLTDGILGTEKFSDGAWLGWWGKDMDATLDLNKETEVKEVSVNALMQSNSWIMLPRKVKFYSSLDGKEWTLIFTATHDVCETDLSTQIHKFSCKLPKAISARYIRVVAVNYGKLPAWHSGAGGDAWIFADEIIVR